MIIDDDEDESNDAAQSDFVRVALNLAYLTEKEARQFRFDKRQMDELKARSRSPLSRSGLWVAAVACHSSSAGLA